MATIVRTFSSCTKACNHTALSMSTSCDIAIASEDGLHILDFCQQPFQCSTQFSFVVTRVPPLDQSYTMDVGIPREDVTANHVYLSEMHMRLVYDRALNVQTSPTYRAYSRVEWSPCGLDEVDRCVLVSLTLDHRVSLYSRGCKKNEWTEVARLSDLQQKYMSLHNYFWTGEDSSDGNAEKYKHVMYSVTTTVLSWSPHLSTEGDKRYGRLTTATHGGHVIFWRIGTPVHESGMHIERVVELPKCGPISSLCWCLTDKNEGHLAVGCVNGCLYTIDLEDYSVTQVWMEQDDIRISSIVWLKELEVMVCSKGTYLLVLRCQGCVDVESVSVQCVSTKLPILGLSVSGAGKVYAALGDATVLVGQVQAVPNTAPSITMETLDIKRTDHFKMTCHGLVISPNDTFIGLLQSPWEMYCHLRLKDPLQLNLVSVGSLEEVTSLVTSSNMDSLHQKCDGLFCLKYHKSLVQLWPELSGDVKQDCLHKTCSELKILRCLVQLKHALVPSTATEEKEQLTSALDYVSERIVINHLTKSLADLTSTTLGQLSPAELQSVCVQCKLLRDLCSGAEDSEKLVNRIESLLPDDMPTESCPICQCNTTQYQLKSAVCPNGHQFARCPQTLQLCHRVPYRVCIWCATNYAHKMQGSTSRWLRSLQSDHCTLCDQILVYCQ